MDYNGGVYFDSTCTFDNPRLLGGHAVVVIGYGTDPKQGEYWLVRNSWGTSWGENGYVKMARNRKFARGMCDLADSATYPLV